MLEICDKLFSRWNENDLLYCHWKSNEHLLPGLEGKTDLDVLLSKNDKQQGEIILHNLGFLHCKSQYGSRYPDVDDWIGFDNLTGKLVHLHLHYELVTGHKGMKEYNLPWTELALDSRIKNDEYGVHMMEPNLEMVTLYTRIGLKADFKNLMRCHFGTFHFPKDVKREIDWLKSKVDMNLVHRLLKNYYHNNAEALLSIMCMDKIDAKTYMKLRKITESNFKKCRRIKLFIRLREVHNFLYQRYVKRLVRKFWPIISKKVPATQKGLTVAFLGQDGAGKTTVTKDIIKWWSWKLDVKNVYLGSGDNYSSIKKSVAKKLSNKGLFRYMKAFLSLSDSKDRVKKAYKNVRKAVKYASKGGLVIYDRFPQMEYAGICDGPRIRKRLQTGLSNKFFNTLFSPLANVEEKYINKILSYSPDIVIKLMLPPEESLRRKPEENYNDVKEKHDIIKTLSFNHSAVYTIDATMPYEQEIILIKNIIWDTLIRRQE